jgi:hypothetical protein
MLGFRTIPFIIAFVLMIVATLLEIVGMAFGCAIGAMTAFDLLVLMTLSLIAAPLVIGNAATGRTQGVATLIMSLSIFSFAVIEIIVVITMLSLMLVSLYLILPYLVYYAVFPFGPVTALLPLIMIFKIAFAFTLVVAHPKFLENFGLVILVATSIGLGALVGILHALPHIMVPIVDAVAGLLILIVAAIRALAFALGALPAIKKAVGI